MTPGFFSAAGLAMLLLWPPAALAQPRTRPSSPAPAAQPGTPAGSPLRSDATSHPAAIVPAANADGVPEYQFGGAAEDRSLLWDSARMVFSLAVVLVVLGVGVKLVRRWPGLGARESTAGPLEVLGRLPLTAKEAVCLVRAGSEVLVVGVSPAGISLLHRLEEGIAHPLRTGVPSPPARGDQRGGPLPGGRWRELAARIRDVQTLWGIGTTDAGTKR